MRMKAIWSRQNVLLLYHSSLFLNNLLGMPLLVFVYIAVVNIEETQFVGKLGSSLGSCPLQQVIRPIYICAFSSHGVS